jgi:hypothetical protein
VEVYGGTHPRIFTCPVETIKSTQVIPIGRIKGVTIDLDGVCTKEYFEVIEIVDDTTQPYPNWIGHSITRL